MLFDRRGLGDGVVEVGDCLVGGIVGGCVDFGGDWYG